MNEHERTACPHCGRVPYRPSDLDDDAKGTRRKARCKACVYSADVGVDPQARERWLAELTALAARLGVAERWQLDLAARILADRPEPKTTGKVTVWTFGQTRAAELCVDLQEAGRLNEWGNWPDGRAGEARAVDFGSDRTVTRH